MKTWRKIMEKFNTLVGSGHGLDKMNGANILKYLLNAKDGKFTWEEKLVLNHFFSQSVDMKNEDMLKFNLSQNECDCFKLSQMPISYAEWDENWNVIRFTLYMPRIKKIETENGFYFDTEKDGSVDLYDEIYDSGEYSKLLKHFNPHWAALKAGLRGWYHQLKDEGVKGFERKPTNF